MYSSLENYFQEVLGWALSWLRILEKADTKNYPNLHKKALLIRQKYKKTAIRALWKHYIKDGKLSDFPVPHWKEINISWKNDDSQEILLEAHLDSILSNWEKHLWENYIDPKIKKEIFQFFSNIYEIVMNDPYSSK